MGVVFINVCVCGTKFIGDDPYPPMGNIGMPPYLVNLSSLKNVCVRQWLGTRCIQLGKNRREGSLV